MRHVDGDREAKSFADLLWTMLIELIADDLSAAVEQRSAAVAGIDRGVGLNQRDAAGLTNRADDAAGDRVGERPERVADGDDLLARPRPEAVDPRRSVACCGFGLVDLKHREIDRRATP